MDHGFILRDICLSSHHDHIYQRPWFFVRLDVGYLIYVNKAFIWNYVDVPNLCKCEKVTYITEVIQAINHPSMRAL